VIGLARILQDIQKETLVKVDRIAFLGLVTAVAAGACVVTSETTDGDGGNGGTGNASQGGSDVGGADVGGADVGGADVGGADVGGADVGGADVGGAGGGACDDSVGTPADCGTKPVECEAYCLAAHNNLKPYIAEFAVECMEVVEAMCTGYECFQEALGYACADETADDDCTTAVATCGDVTAAECHAMLDGLTETARAEVMTCVADTTYGDACELGLWSCVEGVAFWVE
jgi:hypothetical protein